MLKKTITFTDFNGEEATEVLHFNLTEHEALRLEVQFEGGLERYIESIRDEDDYAKILHLFERLIGEAYGEKSPDGRYFIKNAEQTERFMQSAMYTSLFHTLTHDTDEATAFFNGLFTAQELSRNIGKNSKKLMRNTPIPPME